MPGNSPTETIVIMGDYDSTYAWDAAGCVITLEGLGIPGEAALEAEFAAWASQMWDVDDERPDKFPWDVFNQRGLELAQELKRRLGARVRVVYRKHVQDTTRGQWVERIVA